VSNSIAHNVSGIAEEAVLAFLRLIKELKLNKIAFRYNSERPAAFLAIHMLAAAFSFP
jgi:hypothetical protein